jgi:regulator of replication initiation timing
LSAKIEVQDAQKLQQLKQHYHELIEATNRKFIENEKETERLQKGMHVVLK